MNAISIIKQITADILNYGHTIINAALSKLLNYHHQVDGLAERTNQTMITMIWQYLEPAKEQSDWASRVGNCVSTQHSTENQIVLAFALAII